MSMTSKRKIEFLKETYDFVGKKFGMLTVISFAGLSDKDNGGRRKRLWLCKCDCGGERTTSSISLSRKWTTTCGCRSNRNRGDSNPNYKGRGQYSGTYFNTLKKGAKERNLSINITPQDIWNQYLKQDRKCAYTGIDLEWGDRRDKNKCKTASVDRIDSSKGYEIDNIQIVHIYINIMKLDHTGDEFVRWCNLVSSYSLNKK